MTLAEKAGIVSAPRYAKPETIRKAIEEALTGRDRMKSDAARAEVDALVDKLEAALRAATMGVRL